MRALRLVTIFALTLAWASIVSASPQTVPVTTCGQTVPRKAIGYLTGNLDCTAQPNPYAPAVFVDRGGRLDLQGFTITGGGFGVWCGKDNLDGSYSSGKCRVVGAGGTIENSNIAGIAGAGVVAANLTVRNSVGSGIGGGTLKLGGVTLIDNGGDGADAFGDLKVTGSLVSGNHFSGLTAGRRIKAVDSTIVDNSLDSQCGSSANCADIVSFRRPSMKNSVCGTSQSSSVAGQNWGVCTSD